MHCKTCKNSYVRLINFLNAGTRMPLEVFSSNVSYKARLVCLFLWLVMLKCSVTCISIQYIHRNKYSRIPNEHEDTKKNFLFLHVNDLHFHVFFFVFCFLSLFHVPYILNKKRNFTFFIFCHFLGFEKSNIL